MMLRRGAGIGAAQASLELVVALDDIDDVPDAVERGDSLRRLVDHADPDRPAGLETRKLHRATSYGCSIIGTRRGGVNLNGRHAGPRRRTGAPARQAAMSSTTSSKKAW